MTPQSAASGAATDDEPGGAALDLSAYLRILWSHKWVILAVAVSVCAAVVFWTVRQPKIYQATCSIEYDPNPVTPLGHEVEDVANPIGSFWMSREFFSTQNSIISSRAVAERVVRDLGLHRDPAFFYRESFEPQPPSLFERVKSWVKTTLGLEEPANPRGPQLPTVEDAARALQNRLIVEPIEDTRIVAIRVQDRDPRRAAELANAVADAYVQKTRDDRMQSTVGALDWLGNQLDNLRGELDESELALHRFKEEHNVLSVSMEDRQNLVASEITHLNEALTQARTRRIELSARAARVRAAVDADNPEDSAAAFPDNETISSLLEQIRQKISEREGLATRYGPNHTRMQQIDSEVAGMRRQLREEMRGVARAAEADVREVRRVESGLRAALDQAHSSGLELNLREIEYQRLNRERENNAKLYGLVLERTTETDLTRMFTATHVRILDRALTTQAPIRPRLHVNAVGGLGAGLALGLAFALLLGRLDRRLKSVSDVEGLGMTVLGILPRITDGQESAPVYARRAKKPKRRAQGQAGGMQPGNRDIFAHTHPMSAAAECCRTIRTNLTFMSADEPLRTMVVTSASPREGKTTVTTNLAISLAQSGKRVLMVDTDLRRPRIHRAFGVSGVRGITSVIAGDEALENVVAETDVPNLHILPCGPIPPNPSELLHSQKFHDLVEVALKQYDRIVFDSPPLGAVTDAAVLAPQLDAALIVVKVDSTTRDALGSALRQLRDVGANVVGGVLNDVDPRRKGYSSEYYYYRREGYYYSEEERSDDDDDDADSPPPRGAKDRRPATH